MIDFLIKRRVKDILNTGIFKSLEDVGIYAQYLHDKGINLNNIISIVTARNWDFAEGEMLKKHAAECIGKYISRPLPEELEQEVPIYQQEYDLLMQCDGVMRKFLFLLLCYYRLHYHSSGWVRYEREGLRQALGLQKKELQELTRSATDDKHLIEFRIMGSKNPITCYRLKFSVQEGEKKVTVNSMYDAMQKYKQLFKEE